MPLIMAAECPWQLLFPELSSPSPLSSSSSPHQPPLLQDSAQIPSSSPKPTKTFVQALNNACDIPLSQLPIPCVKGDVIAVKIPEEEYVAGMESCKNHLHGRLMVSKGDVPYRIDDLQLKLMRHWKSLSQWKNMNSHSLQLRI